MPWCDVRVICASHLESGYLRPVNTRASIGWSSTAPGSHEVTSGAQRPGGPLHRRPLRTRCTALFHQSTGLHCCYRAPVDDSNGSHDQGRELYLELIKKALTGALSEDNDTVLGGVRHQRAVNTRQRVGSVVGALGQRFGLEVAYKRPYSPEDRAVGRDTPSRAESMIGLARMDNLRYCVQTVIEDNVPGDLIETGVWRGGATIFMRAILKAFGDTTRLVWVADSFQGLPAPDPVRYPADTEKPYSGMLQVGVEQVRHNFRRYGLLDDQVKFLVGWFKDTLPEAPIEHLAVIRLDGDMYESTWQAIEALYPKLSPGGFCIVDDYGTFVTQAQQAIHDYRKAHDISDPIIDIDGAGAYWRKSG
jgi:O-methyltransferase